MILANEAVLTALLVAVLASAVPLMLAAIGEAVGQQSGVLNVGLEGVMLVGHISDSWRRMRLAGCGSACSSEPSRGLRSPQCSWCSRCGSA